MADREQIVADATSSALKAIDLLCEAEELRPVPHLRQAVAILQTEDDKPRPQYNEEARSLLRTALVILDRFGERGAAYDVQSALDKLGEPSAKLSELEADALMEWRRSKHPPVSLN